MSESERQRKLLLELAAEPNDKSSLIAYVNLLGIVALGHTLEIKPTGRGLSDHFEGSLTSRSGARKVNGDASTVAGLARELVHRWMGGSSPLQRPRAAAVLLLALAQQQREPEPAPSCPACKSARVTPAQQLQTWHCDGCGCVFQRGSGRVTYDMNRAGGRCDCTGCLCCMGSRAAPCGLTLGRISGREGLVCMRCDAEQIQREVDR